MRPSVRGADRFLVSTLLLAAAVVTGTAVGLVSGVPWALTGASALRPWAAAVLAVTAVGLDVVHRRTGRVRPLAVRSQVPQVWGRVLGARTAAVLYGARLGVGPLTRLNTWLWWAAAVVAASAGPWAGAAAGAAFAVSRTATMWLAVRGPADGRAMSARMAAVRARDRTARLALAITVVAIVAPVAVLAGCSDDGSDAATDRPARTTSSTTTTRPDGSTVPPTTEPIPEDPALADVLLAETLPGLARADADLGAGPLDLEAAARAEPDVAAERALLETRHFRRGLSRAWTGGDGEVVLAVVYEFAAPSDATAYLRDGEETVVARNGIPFDVPEVPGALGFTSVDESGSGPFTGHAVTFTAGSRWFLVVAGSTGSGATPDDARQLAAAQAAQAG